jgi:hypothetical protein
VVIAVDAEIPTTGVTLARLATVIDTNPDALLYVAELAASGV